MSLPRKSRVGIVGYSSYRQRKKRAAAEQKFLHDNKPRQDGCGMCDGSGKYVTIKVRVLDESSHLPPHLRFCLYGGMDDAVWFNTRWLGSNMLGKLRKKMVNFLKITYVENMPLEFVRASDVISQLMEYDSEDTARLANVLHGLEINVRSYVTKEIIKQSLQVPDGMG